MCMMQIIIQKGMPFDISLGYNHETRDTLGEVIQEKNLNGPYETLEVHA